jgi:zinc transport system ATP-binding protein
VPAAVELEDVTFAYAPGEPVLRDVDLRIEPGEFIAVAGPNGGGKTTLVRLILGLERPSRGSATLFGEEAGGFTRRSQLGYVAQRSQLGVDAPVTVRELVAAGRLAASSLVGPLRARDRASVDEAIRRVGLDERARVQIRRLSGGQQQRAFIAKALAGEPALLVLDEPTAGVDVDAQEELGKLLAQLNRELRVTILYVSHEFGSVEALVDRLLLVQGGIVFDGAPGDLPSRWHDPSHAHVRP